MRAGLDRDDVVPALSQHLECPGHVDERAFAERDDLGRGRQPSASFSAPPSSSARARPVRTPDARGRPARCRSPPPAPAAQAFPGAAGARPTRRPDRGTPTRPSRGRLGDAFTVPEPVSTASAAARRSPITKRSSSFSSAIRRFARATPGSATTPSSVETKFATTRRPSNPNRPGYRDRARPEAPSRALPPRKEL